MAKPQFQVEVDTSEIKVLIEKMRRFKKATLREAEKETDRTAARYREGVIRRSSGRPGPRRITGGYHDTIRIVKSRGWFSFKTSVVSDHPASARLENGFDDTDSSGRVYHQPPFPHWRPTTEEMAPQYQRASSDIPEKAWEDPQ